MDPTAMEDALAECPEPSSARAFLFLSDPQVPSVADLLKSRSLDAVAEFPSVTDALAEGPRTSFGWGVVVLR
jgi:hypothetical protein